MGAPLLAHFEKWAFPMLRKKPTRSATEKPTSQTREVGHPQIGGHPPDNCPDVFKSFLQEGRRSQSWGTSRLSPDCSCRKLTLKVLQKKGTDHSTNLSYYPVNGNRGQVKIIGVTRCGFVRIRFARHAVERVIEVLNRLVLAVGRRGQVVELVEMGNVPSVPALSPILALLQGWNTMPPRPWALSSPAARTVFIGPTS